MLDAFTILTTSGIVLFDRSYTSPRLSPHILNSLINDVFIEQHRPQQPSSSASAAPNPPYKKEKYTLRWTSARDVGLIFVAVYQSLLGLSWVEELLQLVKGVFVGRYGERVKKEGGTGVDCRDFGPTFDALVERCDTGTTRRDAAGLSSEGGSEEGEGELTPPSSSASVGEGVEEEPLGLPGLGGRSVSGLGKREVLESTGTSADVTPVPTPEASRPGTPMSKSSGHLVTAKGGLGKLSRRSQKGQVTNPASVASSGDEAGKRAGKGGAKAKRRWDADGFATEGDDDAVLDYSATTADNDGEEREVEVEAVNAGDMGSRTGKGQFLLKDLDDEVNAIIASSKQQKQTSKADATSDGPSGLLETTTSKLSGLFRNVIGGKTLTKDDLRQPLQMMETHLVEKNVAREAAVRLCSSVETDLLNQKTSSFTSIDATIRDSMAKALTRILTTTSSLDLLRNITRTIEAPDARPYVISIVGVNGVGKSTNLSKIAYFLLQNQLRVLVVAGDTFRSGAVEQLRVHVRNLTELSRRERVGSVELFEKGYGKDAATVARDAVAFATNAGKGEMLYDVVLIDTAGRRHNDTRLMSSLTKFGQLANPDKIFMVGEALVGTDSVAQARNFAKEFVDTKGQLRNNGVGMDGFIISKCDTVGDMVGTLVSMVHATGIPVVFLGVGQHYGDLRGLNVGWAVDKLMK
nr:hypothetical protein B0A51_14814 [Rachicladosporium sp. CCFEE 5018]